LKIFDKVKTGGIMNRIKNLLIELGICEKSSIEVYYPKVRDRNDISVLKCNKSGVIFLSRSDHMDMSYYEEKEGFKYWSALDRKHAVNVGYEDKLRRKEFLQHIVTNRKWMDIGTGSGGILDELSPIASKICAVEPQRIARESLKKLGYAVYSSIESTSETEFDIVTLFHVFEHFTNPLEDLKLIFQKMNTHGKIIIEVPHARDFLISFLDHESFKKFTFWSEHLILHTRQSLTRFLEVAGFEEIIITGCQRYPLANHLHWLAKNQPGGHQTWNFLRTFELDLAYSQMLSKIDKNDTLIAIATKK
jgi:2-polyprenyl-3-methyl-5-hydroxy-6-metoxy-1,4-benzoquinol methylase